MSGLKPGQRKVLFCCFKRNDKREVKVAQLAGSVAEMSAYHHGEVSWYYTEIVGGGAVLLSYHLMVEIVIHALTVANHLIRSQLKNIHFQVSLMMTIVGLAQNFVGSNNLNMLQPLGQFGTRLHGGKDSASPRYIFTMLRSVPAPTRCQYSKITCLLTF